MSTKNDKTANDMLILSKQLLIDFGTIEMLQKYWFSHSRRQIDKEFQEKYNCSYYYAKKIFNNIFGFRDRNCEECLKIQHQNMDKTNLERYGRTNLGQFGTDEHNNAIKEKYGVKNASQANCIKERIKQTNIEKYGIECVLHLESVKEKSKQTWLEKYGVDNPQKAELVKSKSKQTCLEHFNVENPYQSKEIKNKIKNTCLEKYGVENYAQSKEYALTAHRKYFYNNTYFDSSWELALYVYAKDHNKEIERTPTKFEYIVNNKTHYYFPDFKYNGQFIDIKGKQFLTSDNKLKPCYNSNDEELVLAKYQCMLDNNVEIWPYEKVKFAIDYVKKMYGKDYLKQFKTKGEAINDKDDDTRENKN